MEGIGIQSGQAVLHDLELHESEKEEFRSSIYENMDTEPVPSFNIRIDESMNTDAVISLQKASKISKK